MQQQKQGGTATTGAQQAPQLKATGKHEKVNGYDTEVYTLDTDAMKGTFWIAKDVPGANELKNLAKALQNSPMGAMGAAMVQQPEMPGTPIKSDVQLSNGQKMTVTLLSVKEQPIDASEMAPPAGYTEMPMPSFPGGAPGAVPVQ